MRRQKLFAESLSDCPFRSRYRSALLLVVQLAAIGWLSAAEPNGATAPQPRRQITIVALGDSITKGVRSGVSAEQTFAAHLQTKLSDVRGPVRVINAGIGGERTDQALKRIDKILELEPDIVTVMYGTNDSYVDQGQTTSRITVDEYRQNLGQIVVELLRRGIVPILMTEPRWSDDASPNGLGENPNLRLEPYIAACRETARHWRVPLVDHYAKWSEARETGKNLREWTTDGCHPNPAGHVELTAAMLPEIHSAIGPELNARRKLFNQTGETRKLRVVCFGDSVTGVYYHTGSRRAYCDLLGIGLKRVALQANIEMINAGVSGHTTANGLARLERDVLSHKPDLVTVMFGLNDMTRLTLVEYRSNLKQITAMCRAAGSEVVLVTPNNVITTTARPVEKLIQYCDAMREVGRELNLPVCDVYREFEALRAHDAWDWRLLMSDEIHPNIDGHRRIAVALAQTISGIRESLDDVLPSKPALEHSLELLRAKKPLRVLAMTPYDESIGTAIRELYPDSTVTVESWKVSDLSLSQIEQDAKARVRAFKPDLVLIAVPRSATAETDSAFASSFAWIMNWSLDFGPSTWDCVVVHPSVGDQDGKGDQRDDLVRRLVRAQDLTLIDRTAGNRVDATSILRECVKDALAETNSR